MTNPRRQKRQDKTAKARAARLTPKQEAFALEYCRLSNASDAYREVYRPKRASPKTINEAASRLLKNSKIAARIAEVAKNAAEKIGLSVERTLQEVARLSYSDKRKAFRADGRLKQVHELDDDTAAAIASIEVDEIKVGRKVVGYTRKVKFHDKNSALEKAMKYLGLYERDIAQKPLVEAKVGHLTVKLDFDKVRKAMKNPTS